MNRLPRNIRPNVQRANPALSVSLSLRLPLLLLLSFSFLLQTAIAQKRGRAKPAAKADAQATERARRAKALALLIETADEAAKLEDLLYRARLQALAADAMWPFDQQRARVVFRRAWEAATASDKAEQEAAAQEQGALVDAVEPVTEARDEVLAQTARRDATLADVFLRELVKAEKGGNGSEQTEAARSTAWHEPSALNARRIAMAFELLERGETKAAFKLVVPVISTVDNDLASPGLMMFLLRLREQDIETGDALYHLMVTMMAGGTTEANTVLLLSTPIVSPDLLVAVDEYGSLQFRPVARTNAQAVQTPLVRPATRQRFFKYAAEALLRPLRPGASETQERAARYFTTARLLPFFEREAAQYAPELQARAAALLNEFTDSRRDSLSSQLNVRTLGAPPSTDPLRSHFEELARTSEQSERDRITTRIVIIAARTRAWDRARRAAAELNDEALRRAANSFITFYQVADLANAYKDEKEDDYESIVSFLKGVDAPPLAAAWGYAQAARVAARKADKQRVAELLTEAAHHTERADAKTNERIAAYGVIAVEAARLDPQRAWELLTELVRAANAADDYAGDESSIEIRTDEAAAVVTDTPFTFTADVFRLDTIFATMAHLDFERALGSARALEGDVPRAFAQLAVARAGMEKK